MSLSLLSFSLRYFENKNLTVNNVELFFESNGLHCLCGPNGSGKSTLMRAIAGLHNHDNNVILSGSIRFSNHDVLTLPRKDAAQIITYIPSKIIPVSSISVLDFVLQGRFAHKSLLHKNDESDYAHASACLAQVDALHLQEKPIDVLSTGELQLCLIARALTQDPKLLLIDESLSNLDLQHQARVIHELKSISKKIPVMLATHDLNLAARFSDKLILMRNGSIVAQGNAKTVFNEMNIKKTFFSQTDVALPIVVEISTETGCSSYRWK